MMYGYGAGMTGLGWLVMAVVPVVLVVLLVWLVIRTVQPPAGAPAPRDGEPSPSPLETLGRRLAEGSIDVEEYRTARTALEGTLRTPTSPPP